MLEDIFRPELRSLKPYQAATYEAGMVRLNANETPFPGVDGAGLNRYPAVRPEALTKRLAAHYEVAAEALLVTRGSSDAIEVLIRATCRPGQDAILVCPPTFGMYAHYAQVQGAAIIKVPLLAAAGFGLDRAAITAALTPTTKLVFLCSPNNPTGNVLKLADVAALCQSLGETGLVVLDAAYAEFTADSQAFMSLLDEHPNFVMLRTLSKALGLAGVRCGSLIADPVVVDMLGRVLPPYSFPAPCEAAVLAAMEPEPLRAAAAQVDALKRERERMATALSNNPRFTRVWPSQANFLLVEASDARGVMAAAKAGGVLIRDFSRDPATPGCLRITIGNTAENDQLLAALE